jgi:hypothetical protein
MPTADEAGVDVTRVACDLFLFVGTAWPHTLHRLAPFLVDLDGIMAELQGDGCRRGLPARW